MEKLNTVDIKLLNHTLGSVGNATKLLYQELEADILVLDKAYVQMQIAMNKEQILKLHKKMYKYWQGKNGNWNTYLPKEGVKPPYGKLVSKVSEEKLHSAVFDWYIEMKRANKSSPTFKMIYNKWREIKDLELGDNSILKYDGDYKRYFEGTEFEVTPINKITENTIRKFMLETVIKYSLCREACGRLFSYIKNTIRHARIEKLIADNPVEFLELKHFTKNCVEKEKPVEEQFYSHDELIKIKKGLSELYCDMPSYMPRYAVELAMLTGMRAGELAPLMWTDVNRDCIRIDKSVKVNRRTNTHYIDKTKTKKAREFPVCEEITLLLERIKKVQEEHGLLCDYIFSNGEGGYIQGQHISDCMQRLTRKFGLHGGGITALRKTINSNLRKANVPVTIVASMLGHTTEVNERHYTYDTSNLEEKKQIIQQRNAKVGVLVSS